MVNIQKSQPRVHDLVRLDSSTVEKLSEKSALASESWVASSLSRAPWAVVRRARPSDSRRVAVGIRGPERSQRWAAEVRVSDIAEIVTPSEARDFPVKRTQLRAFTALKALSDTSIPLPWGPGGSLGFEMVTGLEAARESSDVDLIVYAETPITDATITELGAIAREVQEITGTKIDILVETPSGAIAFVELDRAIGLASKPTVMLRTSDGPELVKDPWS